MISGFLIRTIVLIVSGVFLLGSWIQTGSPTTSLLSLFSSAVLAVTILLWVWDQWLWRIKPVQMISAVPRDIRGTWKGHLESLWNDPEINEPPEPKTVYLVVRQTCSEISITLISNESTSESSIARLARENGSWVLHYMYTNESELDLRHKSPIHHGSSVYMVSGKPAKRLKGNYWTDRDSKGRLTLSERKKHLADDYEGAEELFRQP